VREILLFFFVRALCDGDDGRELCEGPSYSGG